MGNYYGIDISNNNGGADFSSIIGDGVQIAYFKASEGATFRDKYLPGYYEDAVNNGVKVGSYHFLRGTSSPESQAEHYYNIIKDFVWHCIPMLDVEDSSFDVVNYILRFKARWEELSDMKLGLYTYTSFYNSNIYNNDIIKSMPLWIANYNNDPWNVADQGHTLCGHQYAEKGIVSGTNSKYCDVNYFNDNVFVDNVQGEWILEDQKWWFKKSDGTYPKDCWTKIKNKWYLFDVDGWMKTGWASDEGNWYYLGNENDGAMKIGWKEVDGKWYFLGEQSDDGAMRKGWNKINEKWYHLANDGAMDTGWFKENDNLYYLGNPSDGAMKIGWTMINNVWYYFDETGKMKTGWFNDNGNWYYFDTNGSMHTGWIQLEDKWYLLYSNGQMARNIEEYGYSFDNDGVATKIS